VSKSPDAAAVASALALMRGPHSRKSSGGDLLVGLSVIDPASCPTSGGPVVPAHSWAQAAGHVTTPSSARAGRLPASARLKSRALSEPGPPSDPIFRGAGQAPAGAHGLTLGFGLSVPVSTPSAPSGIVTSPLTALTESVSPAESNARWAASAARALASSPIALLLSQAAAAHQRGSPGVSSPLIAAAAAAALSLTAASAPVLTAATPGAAAIAHALTPSPGPSTAAARKRAQRRRAASAGGAGEAHVCEQCGQALATATSLRQHMRVVHLSLKDHACEACGKTFGDKSSLKSHVSAAHATERPFQCGACERAFARKSDLQAHQRLTHQGARDFACPVCYKTFAKHSNVTRHIETVHRRGKGFRCKTCGHRFTQRASAVRHAVKFHPDAVEAQGSAECLVAEAKTEGETEGAVPIRLVPAKRVSVAERTRKTRAESEDCTA